MHLSNYLENKLLNHLFRGVEYTPPTKIYIALFTGNPTDSNDTSKEVTQDQYPNYTRLDIALGADNASAWSEPTQGSISNTKSLVFPVMTASQPVTITHFGLYDALTGGNLLLHAEITPKVLETSDTISVASTGIVIQLD